MKRRDARSRILMVMGLGMGLVALGFRGGLSPLQNLYGITLAPLTRVAMNAGGGVGDFFHTWSQVGGLSRENANLRRENAELRGRLAATADAARENTDLRRQLGMVQLGAPSQIGADVVAFQPDSYRQFLTLNRGSKDGINVGQVATSDGVVIGAISEASATSSKLQLVTDPEFALTVRDQETGAMGVMRGRLGGGLIVEKIGQSDKVSPGDTIATSGLGEHVPAGLFIGPVETVNAQAGGIFQTATITSELRTERLRFVFVVVGQ